MKLIGFVVLLTLCQVVLNERVCRALALGGGADRGAYEIGALQALIENQNPEKTQYNVLSGISAGALNAGAFAQFKIGKEKEAIAFLTKLWLEMTFSKIASHWYVG
jgi:predicted acylesterase/phospholipase RssA